MKVCIIGGGASGLYCALHIRQNRPDIAVEILEKNPRVGKKLLATGNGKCNFTNTEQAIAHYASETPALASAILNAHTAQDIMAYFSTIGVESTQKDHLVYPRSMQASAVSDALRFKAAALGVTFRTDFTVKSIKAVKEGYIVQGEQDIPCDAVVVACGSAASGGSASGLKLLRMLGHSAVTTYPALVPICTDTTHTRIAKGMRASAKVTLTKNGEDIASETGEILFSDYGISGICIMQVSRHVAKSKACAEKANFALKLDLAPDYTKEALIELLLKRRDALGYLEVGEFLGGFINKKIGQVICKSCGISDFNAGVHTLSDAKLQTLADTIKQFCLSVTDTLDTSHAQVCGGGIRLEEFSDSLMSKIHKGLYACGEVLDVVGDCGGYNLTWAWASGYAVANGICEQ